MYILIIDDQKLFRDLVSKMVEELGHSAVSASSGKEAKSSYSSSQQIDLVICDIVMPDINGYQTAELLQSLAYPIVPPFIFMTSLEINKELQSGIRNEGGLYLPKPINPLLLESQLLFIEKLLFTEKQYQSSQDNLKSIVNASSETIISVNQNGIITQANPAVSDIFIYTPEELVGQDINILISSEKRNRHRKLMKELVLSGKFNTFLKEKRKVQGQRKDGVLVNVEVSINEQINSQQLKYYSVVINDLSKADYYEQQLFHLQHYDRLTGLPNKTLFYDRLKHAIQNISSSKNQLFVIQLSLNGLKRLIETRGDQAGDNLLKTAGMRLSEKILGQGEVSRYRENGFILYIHNCSQQIDINTIINELLALLESPYILDNGIKHYLTVNLGITIYPHNANNVDDLLRQADTSLYRAETTDATKYIFYDEQMTQQANKLAEIENNLRSVISKNELEVYYQPQYTLDKKLVGVEALLRWNHPSKGLISPALFIPAAEKLGYIVELGNWVLEQTCQQILNWQNQGITPVKISVNVSQRQLIEENYLSNVLQTIDDSGVDHNYIELEITESMVLNDIEKLLIILDTLKAHSVSIAIDDFGTGFSSLSYLTQLPVDKLKIDRSFINKITDEQREVDVVKAIISLGKSLNCLVIAEGIETQEQLLLLKQLDCDLIQGYLYGKPVPAEQFTQLLL